VFLPLLQTLIHDIEDYDLPMFGAFHNCAFVKISKAYPLQARRVMHAIWGAGQMAWTKTIFVVDEDVTCTSHPAVGGVRAVTQYLHIERLSTQNLEVGKEYSTHDYQTRFSEFLRRTEILGSQDAIYESSARGQANVPLEICQSTAILVRELAFEIVRSRGCQEKPSRLESLFCFVDRRDSFECWFERLTRHGGPAKYRVLGIEPHPTAKTHFGSDREFDLKEIKFAIGWFAIAERYWAQRRQESESDEFLIEGEFSVVADLTAQVLEKGWLPKDHLMPEP
jgi:hypothetical protein